MSKNRPQLREFKGGFTHWCPGCEEGHFIWDNWYFNGNYEKSTFHPSIKITYNGPNTGQTDAEGFKAPHACCHYFIIDGMIDYCSDSTHSLAGQKVPLSNPPEKEL